MRRHFLLIFLISISQFSFAAPNKMQSGWVWPTGFGNFCGYLGWLKYNAAFRGYHLAQDMCAKAGAPIYAIADGEILKAEDKGGYGCNGKCKGGIILLRHKAIDNQYFTFSCGHLTGLHKVGLVKKGEIIGRIRSDWAPPHVHCSLHPGKEVSTEWYRGYTGNKTHTYGFVDPISYLSKHKPETKKDSPDKPKQNPTTPLSPTVLPTLGLQPILDLILDEGGTKY